MLYRKLLLLRKRQALVSTILTKSLTSSVWEPDTPHLIGDDAPALPADPLFRVGTFEREQFDHRYQVEIQVLFKIHTEAEVVLDNPVANVSRKTKAKPSGRRSAATTVDQGGKSKSLGSPRRRSPFKRPVFSDSPSRKGGNNQVLGSSSKPLVKTRSDDALSVKKDELSSDNIDVALHFPKKLVYPERPEPSESNVDIKLESDDPDITINSHQKVHYPPRSPSKKRRGFEDERKTGGSSSKKKMKMESDDDKFQIHSDRLVTISECDMTFTLLWCFLYPLTIHH
ncbi:uncharacterized protein MELLADRAFT_111370 [Melampsora larici-populina 98AG31]|uniref:Uncharacterized protein n=1 Tax=Melampsora larici-populina (strain 98AG31 / pathotype 3-4-7) TaxID=747676 RepID=F4S2Z7_MELLP|nr:uncharacterized protein MELLADRAFT_111370 [Melampsora larici-populina 98AG31]EGG00889.1 hypothetical protein MELLADRAFT_111370 [Melampsora larici-populina 98AG31]